MISAKRVNEVSELQRLLLLALEKMSVYAEELNKLDNGDRKIYKEVELWKADNK